MLIITYTVSTSDTFLPAFIARESKEDSWIAVIIGTIISLIIVNIFITLGLRYPNKTIVQYSCDVLGKPLGKVIGFLYLYFFIIIASVSIRTLEEILATIFRMKAPIVVFGIITVAVAAYAVMNGLEVIARINEILLPIGLLMLLAVVVSNVPNLDLSHFLPVFYNGIIPSLKGSLLVQGWIAETVIILHLIPYVKDKEKIRKYTNIAIVWVFMSFLAGTLVIAVFGAELTANFLFPALQYARYISLGPDIQNLDIVIMIFWLAGMFIKIALSYYGCVSALSQMLSLKSYKNFIVTVGLTIIIFASAISKMLVEFLFYIVYITPFYNIFMAFVIPLILLVVSVIRKQKKLSQFNLNK